MLREIEKRSSKELNDSMQLEPAIQERVEEPSLTWERERCPYNSEVAPVLDCLACATDPCAGSLVGPVNGGSISVETKISLQCKKSNYIAQQKKNIKKKNLRLIPRISELKNQLSNKMDQVVSRITFSKKNVMMLKDLRKN